MPTATSTPPSRRALVTGGSRGLGFAIARALARDGLEVLATWAHDEAAARAAELRHDADRLPITLTRCDATSAAQVAALFDRAGPVDVLVHAAGFTRDRLLVTMTDQDFDDLIAVHVTGASRASRHALPAMCARGWGRLVYLVSPIDIIPDFIMNSNQASLMRLIVLGLVLMLLMIYRPQGIFGDRRELAIDAR